MRRWEHWLLWIRTGGAIARRNRTVPGLALGGVSIAGLLVSVLAAQVPFASPVAAPQAVHTNRQAFRIPYQVDPQEIARLGAREIRLFMSRDRGQRWEHAQSVAPQSGRFEFTAPVEGEYWFTVQTVDRNGQLHPGGQVLQPGLVVVVDMTRPTLHIDLREPEPGRVAVQWDAGDTHVDPESLSLEFTQTGMTEWQSLAFKSAATGQTEWSVPLGGMVAVRGKARDLAGNEVHSQYQVQIRPASQRSAPPIPDANAPVAMADPFGRTGAGLLPYSPPGPAAPAPLSAHGAPGLIGQLPRGGNPAGAMTVPGLSAPFESAVPAPVPAPRRTDWPDSSLASQPQWRDQFVSNIPTPDAQPAFESEAPTGYRVVNSRKFQIDYRIDDVGPSGVGSVELFVTQNNGEKWYRYGLDDDRRSPFEVEVPADGVYGFSIRVTSGAGLAPTPPQPAEQPEVVIVVDSSPPVVQLFPLKQGSGADSNRVLITWQVADQKLHDRPIALSYSATPNGPWEPIADWQPNTGHYIWSMGPGVPARLFVRVIARDSAGNMARVDTPQPVLVDLSKPTARIVDVDSGSRGGELR